jgi:hypothetical protein
MFPRSLFLFSFGELLMKTIEFVRLGIDDRFTLNGVRMVKYYDADGRAGGIPASRYRFRVGMPCNYRETQVTPIASYTPVKISDAKWRQLTAWIDRIEETERLARQSFNADYGTNGFPCAAHLVEDVNAYLAERHPDYCENNVFQDAYVEALLEEWC